ncbi:DMT family transporter [Paenibacillus prosopidis]|uniref:Quaternary ammonium compound-resistance protein SugE n=1 Tax=Paenibacillus prosopidis TaxID=630520 RepID=A0A368VZ82_9BACL|nr:multidrug efflux SMR transporter [Paenibacillus prosopidis]RCW44919.1 quaternary ammonium compound-resistance protein SugE [Paenibacillus prosopidis]
MPWIYLLLAGFLEVGWTFGLKYSEGFTKLVPSLITVVVLAASFMLFARAMRTFEIGVAYALFTGIGTVGTVIAGILILHEPADFWRLFFIALLVGGIVGLKLISNEKPAEAVAGAEALSQVSTEAAVAAPLYEQPEAAVSSDNRESEKVGS